MGVTLAKGITAVGIAEAIHTADTQTTPADGDEFGFVAGASPFPLVKTTWANLKTTLGGLYQPLSANLTEYATVDPTAAGLALLDDADAAAQRTTLGLGNVENIALSTWAGSTNLTTVGTLASGAVPISLLTGLGTNVGTALGTALNGTGAFAGTTSPTFVTPILGVASGTSFLSTASSATNVAFGRVANHGIFFPTSTTIGFSAAATERLRILAASICSSLPLALGSTAAAPDVFLTRAASGSLSVGSTSGATNGLITVATVNATTGFQVAGAAASGNVLRGNGTNFVSAQLAAADLSNGTTGTGIVVLAASPALTSPTLAAGTTAAGTAPEKNTDGTRLTAKEVGAKEYEKNFYFTNWKSIRFPVGGPMFDYFADVPVGGAEADIFSSTLLADTFSVNGDKVVGSYSGNFVTLGTELTQLKAYFAGTGIWDSTGITMASGTSSWRVLVELWRVSSTVVRYCVSLQTSGASGYVYCTAGELTGLTLTGTNILKITGTSSGVGSGAGDIVGKQGAVEYKPAVN